MVRQKSEIIIIVCVIRQTDKKSSNRTHNVDSALNLCLDAMSNQRIAPAGPIVKLIKVMLKAVAVFFSKIFLISIVRNR